MEREIGIVGLGYWGKNILRNLYELKVVRTACDFNEEIIKERKKTFPDINYTTYYEDLLEDPNIKGIVVATPSITHYALSKKALLAGKDVLVEKPMTTSLKEGEELVNLADKNGLILMVGHILHYHPAVKRMKELILKGLIGKILYIYSNRVNIGKLRTDENVWWSLAPHDISLILMLAQSNVINFIYNGTSHISKGIDDIALASLEFENGIKAHIFVSWWHPFKEQRLVVIGEKGMIVFDDVSKEKLFYYSHKVEWINNIPIAKKGDLEVIKIEEKEPLKEELRHFWECIKERKKPETDGYEGLRVLEVLEKCQNSIKVVN
ncbi:MAG: Gfo/Idh/MocA family oxidoreductase [Dictyoglomus sp.]|nr:Gfo/Idh/MocA family oxidoreductase [Dictyoglomus sp.]MDW8188462.1 Gfo/Idh/MocA family oxidoreductase [Dictyoglomus sp.]